MKRTLIQILLVCGVLAGLGVWRVFSDRASPSAGADKPGGTSRSGAMPSGGSERRGSSDHPGISTEKARLLDLVAAGRDTPGTSAQAAELAAILAHATEWNRKELRSVIGDLMNEPLTEPARARPFMKLLSLYSQ